MRVGGINCEVKSVTLDTIVCVTGPSDRERSTNIQVLSRRVRYAEKPKFRYTESLTPVVHDIQPESGELSMVLVKFVSFAHSVI